MSAKLPTGITSRVNDSNGRKRKQYRASLSDPSTRADSGRARRVTSRWFDTFAEAKEWRENQLTRLKTLGGLAKDLKTSMSDACETWLTVADETGVDGRSPIEFATKDRYRSSIRSIVKPTIGLLRISEISSPMLIKWRDDVALSNGRDAANRALAVVKQVLKYHASTGAIQVDPSASVRPLQIKKKFEVNEDGDLVPVEEFMSPAIVERILKAAKDLATTGRVDGEDGRGLGEYQREQRAKAWQWARPLIYLLILGGLRIGEASALQWGDVDWDKRTLLVRRARKRDGSVGAPKNKTSIRTIKMGAEFMAVLRELYVRANDREPSHYIFGSDRTRPLVPNNFTRRQWGDLQAAAGLLTEDGKHQWTPHDCRHYHASVLILANTNLQLVADRLGHANTMVTQTVYAHLFQHMKGEANTAGADLEGVLLGR